MCAACALVAAADGDIEESEKRKVVSIVTGHATLGKLYQQNVIEQTADIMFKRARTSPAVSSLPANWTHHRPSDGATMAEDVYLIALDIANADGEIEPQEDVVLKKIATRLALTPASSNSPDAIRFGVPPPARASETDGPFSSKGKSHDHKSHC